MTATVEKRESRGLVGFIRRLILGPSPFLYVLPIAAAMVGAFALHMRMDGIFACPADQYGGDHYLGHCEVTAYGDYDHGAVWFDLEPKVSETAAKADVLFLGSSRTAFGLSAPALGHWFAKNDRDYYILGFSHFENMTFEGPLLQKIKPKARAYVINVDGFFTEEETGPGRDVMHGPDTERRYQAKQVWQDVHNKLCGAVPKLCGNTLAFYRQRDTGQWSYTGDKFVQPADNDVVLPLDAEEAALAKPYGEKFIASLGVPRECVILTYIPPKDNNKATAVAIAASLGYELISPDVPGLRTFDGSHLDQESAQKFVSAFMEQAGPKLQPCLGIPVAAAPAPAPATDVTQ